jgi:hypothetical protein
VTEYVYLNQKYDDLPILHRKPDALTDEAREFDSDIAYMRDLLKDIAEMLDIKAGKAWSFLTVELDIIEAELASIEVKR